MKKLFLVPAFLLAGLTTSHAQVSLAPEVGVNFSNLHSKANLSGNTSVEQSGKLSPGFTVGLSLNAMVTNHIGIRPGVYYDFSGNKYENDILGVNTSTNYHFSSIQVPVYITYYSNNDMKDGFFVGVGPFMNYYFSGKGEQKISSGSNAGTTDFDVKFGNDKNDDLKPLNFGGSVTAGYMLSSGLSVRAYFNLGISNLHPNGDNDNKTNSKSFGISVGYNL